MPTYQYACTECGHSFEKHQAFTDASLSECPTCGGRLRKMFHNVGIVFKGSGFYRNDSREGAKKDREGAKKDGAAPVAAKDSSSSKDTSSSQDGGSTKEKKADSKPAAASPSTSGGSSSSGSSSTSSSSTSGSAA